MCLAALFVSCKIHDTLKKTRDLLVASYGVRYPERAAKAKSMGGEIDIDPNVSLNIFLLQFSLIESKRSWKETDRESSPLKDLSSKQYASTSTHACLFRTLLRSAARSEVSKLSIDDFSRSLSHSPTATKKLAKLAYRLATDR